MELKDEKVGEVYITLDKDILQVFKSNQFCRIHYVELCKLPPYVTYGNQFGHLFIKVLLTIKVFQRPIQLSKEINPTPISMLSEKLPTVIIEHIVVLGNDIFPQSKGYFSLLRVNREEVVLIQRGQESMNCGEFLILIPMLYAFNDQLANYYLQGQD